CGCRYQLQTLEHPFFLCTVGFKRVRKYNDYLVRAVKVLCARSGMMGFRASPVSIMATSSARCESPGVDPWTCMPKHSNPQPDMLEHPIFALPHNRIHPYSDDALAALGRTPTLVAGRKSADRPTMG